MHNDCNDGTQLLPKLKKSLKTDFPIAYFFKKSKSFFLKSYPYFCGASRGRKAVFMPPGSKAFARMTIGDVLPSGTTCYEWWFPLYRHPLSLARGSRAKSPYFSGASTPLKKRNWLLPGSKAYARMTASPSRHARYDPDIRRNKYLKKY